MGFPTKETDEAWSDLFNCKFSKLMCWKSNKC